MSSARKYSREIIELMAAFPGRPFRMRQIVQYVRTRMTGHEPQRVRNGVLDVLKDLMQSGHVECAPALSRGSYATYTWIKLKQVPEVAAIAAKSASKSAIIRPG